MNELEDYVKGLSGIHRYEKREAIASFVDSLIKKSAIQYTIERVILPEDEFMQLLMFKAYGNTYAWIDYCVKNKLDSTRLELVNESDNSSIIIFEDDFGVMPAYPIFRKLVEEFGVIKIK